MEGRSDDQWGSIDLHLPPRSDSEQYGYEARGGGIRGRSLASRGLDGLSCGGGQGREALSEAW